MVLPPVREVAQLRLQLLDSAEEVVQDVRVVAGPAGVKCQTGVRVLVIITCYRIPGSD